MPGVNLIEPDVTLRLDHHGVIRDASSSSAIKGELLTTWVGQAWADTVVESSGDHVRQVIEDAGSSGASILLQLRQRFPSGREMLMEYTTVRLGDGSDLLAVGKNLHAVTELQARLLEAQREREQNSWKSRDLETRYRLLFDASHEALALLDAKTLNLIEVNPAATRDLGLSQGDSFLDSVVPKEQKRLQAMFRRVRDYGRSPRILIPFGQNRAIWAVRASLLPAEPEQILMVQLSPIEESRPAVDLRVPEEKVGYSIEGIMERFPDGFVVIDGLGVIERANRAFVDLLQIKSESALIGEKIGRWLTASVLGALAETRMLHDFSARIRREDGVEMDILVSGVAASEGGHQYFGLMLHVNRRSLGSDDGHWQLQQASQALASSGGKATLPMLVKESSEMLERRYIEAALTLSNGNRTAAAELLGISRQSLHLKLNRYASLGVGSAVG